MIIFCSGVVYFLIAWWRYQSFRAGALDLGFWDQIMYLISTGQLAYSTIMSNHALADHAAVVLYPIAQLYRIYPTVAWLLAIQAGSMAGAAWPLWRLAREARIDRSMCGAIVIAYLFYPVVAAATTRDFYPEALAIPAMLAMVLCARRQSMGWFLFWLLLGLSTKEVMSISFAVAGLYLAIAEERKRFGWICFVTSVIWYVIATRGIIPHFGLGHEFNSARFYSYMGNTPGQVVATMITRPWVWLRVAFSGRSIIYLPIIFIPVIWGLAPRRSGWLICAVPCVLMNLLSNKALFRDPTYHYSWPIVPFVFLAVIDSVASGESWFGRARWVIVWSASLVLFAIVARTAMAKRSQLIAGASNGEKRRVIGMINDDGGVIASHQIASHLTHRKWIQFVYDPADKIYKMPPDETIDWVILDFDEDSMRNAGQFALDVRQKYQSDPRFAEVFHDGAIYLFHRTVSRTASFTGR